MHHPFNLHLLRAALLCLSLCSFQASKAAHWLFRNGKSDYTIVLPANASQTEKTAAHELRDILRQISGATLPVATTPPDGSDKCIHIGWTEALGASQPLPDDEGFTLTMTVKRKLEGKKRPELVEDQERFNYSDIKYTKNIIKI